MATNHINRQLVLAGAVLFFLGLLQGGIIQNFFNPRMALSAHLTAVQSGTAIMVVGAVWSAVSLSAKLAAISRHTIIIGMYLLWIALTLSAMTGASEILPIAGEGHSANQPIELAIVALIGLASGLMILGWAIFILGLFRNKQQ